MSRRSMGHGSGPSAERKLRVAAEKFAVNASQSARRLKQRLILTIFQRSGCRSPDQPSSRQYRTSGAGRASAARAKAVRASRQPGGPPPRKLRPSHACPSTPANQPRATPSPAARSSLPPPRPAAAIIAISAKTSSSMSALQPAEKPRIECLSETLSTNLNATTPLR